MSKCFISYRHIKPDEDLAHFLKDFLGKHNYDTFLDTRMLIGTEWVKEIEKQIKSSDFFIVLLSADSILSNMVRQEVKLAHELKKKRNGKFTILPIRVDFDGELPYDLGAYLDGIQYGLWKQGEDFTGIAQQVLAAVESRASLPISGHPGDEEDHTPGLQILYEATEAKGAPLPAADPRIIPQVEMESGTVKPGSPFYIERNADRELAGLIPKHGFTAIVKGPRQMGKSSLLVRARVEAMNLNHRCCYLDFQFAGQSHLENLDSLFRYLAHKLCREFKTAVKPSDCWDEYLGAKDNITDFIKAALLEQGQPPVLLLLDEVDRLFNRPYRDDFFAVVRGWHNLRAVDEAWNRLNLAIAHSTEPYLWIQDIDQSPFNVGTPIKLHDFDPGQVRDANAAHGSPIHADEGLSELLTLTGGQPYLVRLALYTMAKTGISLSQLQQTAGDDRGPFGDHLRQILWRLQENRELIDSLRLVMRRGECEQEPHFLRLRSAGLIAGESRDRVRMRCQLYEDYLRKHL